MLNRRDISVLFLVACAVTATVDESSAREAPLLLYGPDGPGGEFEARASAAFDLMGEQRRTVPLVRHVDTVLVSLPEVDVVGTGEFVSCPASPQAVETFVEELDRAEQHIYYVEVEEATRILERLDTLVPCLNDVLPRGELARISFLRGVAQAHAEDVDAALESFRQALVVSPQLRWDSRFPPSHERIFNDALHQALNTSAIPLDVLPGVGDVATLWIDGLAAPEGGGPCTLPEGRHLLQWKLDSGEFVTRAVLLVEGDSLTAIARADVGNAVLSGQGNARAREIAAGLLGDLAASEGRETLYLAELGEADLLHRFEVTAATWTLSDAGAVAAKVQFQRRTDAGGTCLVAGIASLGIGSALGIVGYTRATALAGEVDQITSQDMAAEKEADFETSRDVAYVGYGTAIAGGVAAVVGVVLLATNGRERTTGPQHTKAAVRIEVGPSYLGISGSF